MTKKKAKLVFKHNYFEIVEEGDYVDCAISGKKIPLNNLNYWNVNLQEAYFSAVEADLRYKELNTILERMIIRNPGQWIWTHNRWK